MKTLMIIGAGIYQLPLIRYAATRTRVVLVAPEVDSDVKRMVDKVFYTDVRNVEAILEFAKREKVDGVITDQTDIPVRTVAYVAEKLGLSGNPYKTAELFTDKFLMRERCREIGYPVLEYTIADTIEEALAFFDRIRKTVILKPVDNQGSRGIIKVHNEEELKNVFENTKKFSACGKVLIEQYVQGREFVVEGMALNYEYRNLIYGDTIYFKSLETFSANRRVFPTTAEEKLKNKLLAANEKIAKGFGFKQGITHGEYILGDDGEIYLIEIAARGGGVHISSDLISLKTGLNTEKFLVDIALGELRELPQTQENGNVCGYVAFYLPEGVVENADAIKKLDNMPFVKNHICNSIYAGMKIGCNTDKTTRFSVIIDACDRMHFESYRKILKEELTIPVLTKTGIKYPIWE